MLPGETQRSNNIVESRRSSSREREEKAEEHQGEERTREKRTHTHTHTLIRRKCDRFVYVRLLPFVFREHSREGECRNLYCALWCHSLILITIGRWHEYWSDYLLINFPMRWLWFPIKHIIVGLLLLLLLSAFRTIHDCCKCKQSSNSCLSLLRSDHSTWWSYIPREFRLAFCVFRLTWSCCQ